MARFSWDNFILGREVILCHSKEKSEMIIENCEMFGVNVNVINSWEKYRTHTAYTIRFNTLISLHSHYISTSTNTIWDCDKISYTRTADLDEKESGIVRDIYDKFIKGHVAICFTDINAHNAFIEQMVKANKQVNMPERVSLNDMVLLINNDNSNIEYAFKVILQKQKAIYGFNYDMVCQLADIIKAIDTRIETKVILELSEDEITSGIKTLIKYYNEREIIDCGCDTILNKLITSFGISNDIENVDAIKITDK